MLQPAVQQAAVGPAAREVAVLEAVVGVAERQRVLAFLGGGGVAVGEVARLDAAGAAGAVAARGGFAGRGAAAGHAVRVGALRVEAGHHAVSLERAFDALGWCVGCEGGVVCQVRGCQRVG